jgi:hypothetical protein
LASPACIAFQFDKSNKSCSTGSGQGLRIQTNESYIGNSTAFLHIKVGTVVLTNGGDFFLTPI